MASTFDVNSMAGLSGMDVHIEVLSGVPRQPYWAC